MSLAVLPSSDPESLQSINQLMFFISFLQGQVSHVQSPMDLLSHDDGMPAGSHSAEADCPIVFQSPDGDDHAEEEEQAMQLWQEEVEEEMGMEPPAENGAVSGRRYEHVHIPAL